MPVCKEQFVAMADLTNLPAGAMVRNVRIMKEVVGDVVQVRPLAASATPRPLVGAGNPCLPPCRPASNLRPMRAVA